MGWLSPRQLFLAQGRVRGIQYLAVGITLALVKYAVECLVVFQLTGLFFSPVDFVSPFLSSRVHYLENAPQVLGWFWVLWTLPFLWVCLAMSMKRCADAGVSLWIALMTLVPFLNLAVMPFLAAMPSSNSTHLEPEENPFQVTASDSIEHMPIVPGEVRPPAIAAVFVGLFVGAGYLVVTILFSVYVLGSYGAAMFFGAPVVTTAAGAFWLNYKQKTSIGYTLSHSLLILLVVCGILIALALEGGICFLMAMPILAPMAFLGSITGYVIASSSTGKDERRGLYGCMAILPLLAVIEANLKDDVTLEVRSSVLVEASPDRVWSEVITFSEIREEPTGLFQWGVAYPLHAYLDGEGVGAVRHCVFTTGEFIEPITTWVPAKCLAFDVAQQPEPMTELSPYSSLHPPHLDGTFRSVRGEFRMVRISEQQTRLEGSTWYRLDLQPKLYWKLWTDHVIHRIHHRVLKHIQSECESTT